jgi:hypothetical protein
MIDETFAGRLEKCVSSESMRAAKFPPQCNLYTKIGGTRTRERATLLSLIFLLSIGRIESKMNTSREVKGVSYALSVVVNRT